MHDVTIELAVVRREDLVRTLYEGVRAFNTQVVGDSGMRPLMALAWSGDRLVGGVVGRTVYHHLLIEVVWIDASKRGQGLGRQLMMHAEAEVRTRGCIAAQVDTLSFQGLACYQRLGFVEVGRVDAFPPGHSRHFLVKAYLDDAWHLARGAP